MVPMWLSRVLLSLRRSADTEVQSRDADQSFLPDRNLITPDTILAAKAEIQHGVSVALNWAMQNIAQVLMPLLIVTFHAPAADTSQPAFDRRPLQRKILELRPFRAYDEEISLNTQAGSQWDGFKQWGHQRTGLYYNGLRHEDVPFANDNGIHHWTEKGGIVGRGVLLDYVAYAARKGFTYDPWTRHEITVEALEEMCAFEGVTLRQADILIVRSGFLRRYNDADPDEQVRGLQHNLCFVGLQGSERMIEWLWDHHFSALAGDTVALEAWPPQDPWSECSRRDCESSELY